MIDKKECIVLIPIYKRLEFNDREALYRLLEMTSSIDKVFISPENFTMDDSFHGFEEVSVERFDDSFFADIIGYNRLMLDVNFYRRFRNYKYMLIHQLDVFLFKPELPYWCYKNYDYIGAPWLRPHKIKIAKFLLSIIHVCPWICTERMRKRLEHYNNVGNGGLSLRRIETFIKILESSTTTRILNNYLRKQALKDSSYNEDVFWSLEGPRLYQGFHKPDWQEAIYFAIENKPSFAYNRMNNQLPFGCHKPVKHEPDFWKDHISFVRPEVKER